MSKVGFEFQEKADPQSLSYLEKINNSLNFLFGAVRAIKIDLPEVFRIRGNVTVDRVDNLPPLQIANFPDQRGLFSQLGKQIEDLQVSTLKAFRASTPNGQSEVKIGNEVVIKNWNDLVDGFEELKKGLNILINKDDDEKGNPTEVSITNFPPQMVPQPVTSVDIKGLRGFAKSTAVTVPATGVTPLPSPSLSNRRSLVAYNNDASATLYIGGSDVTASNGIPVPAGTYSPAVDASPGLVVYGVSSSGSIDIRVLELSQDAIGA